MEMLGERIRKYRKQKKMTLEALAGTELTKGMLSLIENNKAKPSMESLAYIAEQLGIEISELLEEVSSQELRDILDEAEKLYNPDDYKNHAQQIVDLIEPYIQSLSQGYESARLLDLYFRSLYWLKNENWREYADKAAKLYEELNISSRLAAIGIMRTLEKYTAHDYEQSLQIFLEERNKIEANKLYIDPMTRLDLDYHEAIFHFAVGDSKSAISVMENAINFSKEHRTFYRMDDLYRIATVNALFEHDSAKKDHYLMKLKQYGEFADDVDSILFYQLMNIYTLNAEEQKYNEANEMIDENLANDKMADVYKHYFYLEKGKALYGLSRFEEALHWLEKTSIPSVLHHPFDLSLLGVKDSYKALCYLELNDLDKAFQSAQATVDFLSPLPHTPFKDFATETFEKINNKKIKLAED